MWRILIFERESLNTPHRTFQTSLGTITKSLYKDKKKTDDRGKYLKEFVEEEMARVFPLPHPSQIRGEIGEYIREVGHCLLEVDTESYSLASCCSAMETCRFGADWRTRKYMEVLDLCPLLWRA